MSTTPPALDVVMEVIKGGFVLATNSVSKQEPWWSFQSMSTINSSGGNSLTCKRGDEILRSGAECSRVADSTSLPTSIGRYFAAQERLQELIDVIQHYWSNTISSEMAQVQRLGPGHVRSGFSQH